MVHSKYLLAISWIFLVVANAWGATVRLDFTKANTTGPDAVWVLDKYAFEEEKDRPPLVSLKEAGKNTKPPVTGSVATIFNGEAGFYTLTFEYLDWPGGRTTMQLRVDGKPVGRWYGGNLFSEITSREVVEHVELKKGSRIEWIGREGGTDPAALLALEIAPGTPAPPVPVVAISATKYSDNLVPVADYVRCADPRLMIPLPSRTWPDAGMPKDPATAPAFLFRAVKGQRFEATIGNPGNVERSQPWSIRRWPGEGEPLAAGTVTVPAGAAATVAGEIAEDGVYALRCGGAVTGVTHPLTRTLGGVGNVHFFMPKGTAGIRVVGPASAKIKVPIEFILRDAAGTIVHQGEVEARQKLDLPIPGEKTGEPWFFECASTLLTLEGVPPQVALQAADLLAPAEVLPGQKIAAEPLPVPDPAKPLAATAMMPGAAPVTLVKDGQPACVIVTRSGAEAAADLQQVLQQVTGALIPIVQDLPPQGSAIVLATDTEFPNLPVPSNFKTLNNQGLAIRTERDRLYLIGREQRALRPAVYTFLRQIGCRWYFGYDQWELLPRTRDLTVAQDLVTQPDFLLRRISVGSSALLIREMGEWGIRNRLGSGVNGGIYHSYAQFVSHDLFKTHPEYFSMRDTNGDGVGDERTNIQPCTTHPEVVKLFLENAVKKVTADPTLDLLCVSPNDGTINMCRCDRCRALGTYSDCAWTLAHQVANELRAKFPDRKLWVGFYAYGVVSRPPTLKVEADPDIVVQIATAYNKVSVAKMVEEWPKFVGMIGIREYFAIPQWGGNNPGRGVSSAKARRVIPQYKANKAVMLNAESCPAWGGSGQGMYLAAQLMWDSAADADAILAEFYTDCFGAGAPAMKRYFDRWNRETIEPRTAKMALTDLREALVKADTVGARRRVAMFVLYIHSLQLHSRWTAGDIEEDDKDEYIEAGGTFQWRTRNLGMLRRSYQFIGDYSGLPYYTYEETLALLDQDLAALKDVDVGELLTQFGSDLTPVTAQAVGKLRPAGEWFTSENRTWVLNAVKDTPITIHATGKDGKLKFRLIGPQSSAAPVEKELVLSGDRETVQLPVAVSGLHHLVVTAEKAQYRVAEPANVATAVIREKNKPWYLTTTPGGGGQVCFYVPIGAEAIYVGFTGKSAAGGVVEVCDNQGRVVHKFDERRKDGLILNEPVLLHVPEGGDNQVWMVRVSPQVGAGKIMLRGVPPYVHADPNRLLVPKVGQDEPNQDE